MTTVDLDADLGNADWTKSTWDLPFKDAGSLRDWIKARGGTVEEFKGLPLYARNVKRPGMEWLKDL